MLMRDVPIGEMVFLEERMDKEVRETFYCRTSETTYRQHGLIQGDPELSVRQYDEAGKLVQPRYRRFVEAGYEYPIVLALPVRTLSESRFFQYTGAAVLQGVKLECA